MRKKIKWTKAMPFLVFSLVLFSWLFTLNGSLPAAIAGEKALPEKISLPAAGPLVSPKAPKPSPNLLEDWFGVQLGLVNHGGGDGPYAFDLNSFAPTKHTGTADYVQTDWYGKYLISDIWGQKPHGGETYDVEALYLDNDQDNLYLAIVTSFPFPYNSPGAYFSGDVSLDFGYGTPRVEKFGNWHYNYGLDLVHENRDLGLNLLRDTALGSALYKTMADSGGSNILDPGLGFDWYSAAPPVEAGWEHTNFDPLSTKSSGILTKLGDAGNGIKVDYYLYQPAGWGSKIENNRDTYVIEATIPFSVLPVAERPVDKQQIGVRWVMSCRNDGIQNPVALLRGDINLKKDEKTSVSGHKYNDLNGNGTREGSEPYLQGWEIDAVKGGITKKAFTDAGGYYEFIFTGSEAGTWTISEVAQPGWAQTAPAVPGTYTVAVQPGTVIQNKEFGNRQMARVSGHKYNDLNGNSTRDGGEPYLQGWEIDAVKGGVTKKAFTDAGGYYEFTFTGSEAGTWTISEVAQPGWAQTAPAAPGTYTVAVQPGTIIQNKEFGNRQTTSETGKVIGNGQIAGNGSPGFAAFKFDVVRWSGQSQPQGAFIYKDTGANVNLSSTGITAFSVDLVNKTASFTGTAKSTSGAIKVSIFKVAVVDKDGAGSDSFEIWLYGINGNEIYHAKGDLKTGNISVLSGY